MQVYDWGNHPFSCCPIYKQFSELGVTCMAETSSRHDAFADPGVERLAPSWRNTMPGAVGPSALPADVAGSEKGVYPRITTWF